MSLSVSAQQLAYLQLSLLSVLPKHIGTHTTKISICWPLEKVLTTTVVQMTACTVSHWISLKVCSRMQDDVISMALVKISWRTSVARQPTHCTGFCALCTTCPQHPHQIFLRPQILKQCAASLQNGVTMVMPASSHCLCHLKPCTV